MQGYSESLQVYKMTEKVYMDLLQVNKDIL
jgi:hypothetical protein